VIYSPTSVSHRLLAWLTSSPACKNSFCPSWWRCRSPLKTTKLVQISIGLPERTSKKCSYWKNQLSTWTLIFEIVCENVCACLDFALQRLLLVFDEVKASKCFFHIAATASLPVVPPTVDGNEAFRVPFLIFFQNILGSCGELANASALCFSFALRQALNACLNLCACHIVKEVCQIFSNVFVTSHSSCVFLYLVSSANISPERFVLYLQDWWCVENAKLVSPSINCDWFTCSHLCGL